MTQVVNEDFGKAVFSDKNYPFMTEGEATMREFSLAEDSGVHFAVPPRKSYDHVKDKELRKKLKNRESAQAARDRKKAKMMFLERQVSDLIERNRYLERENIELRKRIQIMEADSFWRTKRANEGAQNINQPQFNSSPEHHQDSAYPQNPDHVMGHPSNQTSCAFLSYPNEVSSAMINGNPQGFAKMQQTTNTDVNGNLILPRGMGSKCEVFPPEEKIFNQPMQQFMMHDSSGEHMIHSGGGARFREHGFNQFPKIDCNPGSYPSSSGSNNSTGSSRSSSTSAGENGMNAEDWLMLSFKPDISSNPVNVKEECNMAQKDAINDQPPFIHPPQTGQEYNWTDIPLNLLSNGPCHHNDETKCHTVDQQRLLPPDVCSYNFHENNYCDSVGIESMSSPDISAGSTVSSPEAGGGMRQEFPPEKHAFKVH